MKILKSMGMMRCEEALERLWEFLDGELGLPEARAIRQHIEICDRCYPEYDFRRTYTEFTRSMRGNQKAPAELRRRVFQVILEYEGASR